MSDKTKQKISKNIKLLESNMIQTYSSRALFFMLAGLFTLILFDEFIILAAAKPEYAEWFNTLAQSQLKLVSRVIAVGCVAFAFASVSVALFEIFQGLFRLFWLKIKRQPVQDSR